MPAATTLRSNASPWNNEAFAGVTLVIDGGCDTTLTTALALVTVPAQLFSWTVYVPASEGCAPVMTNSNPVAPEIRPPLESTVVPAAVVRRQTTEVPGPPPPTAVNLRVSPEFTAAPEGELAKTGG